MPTNQQQLIKSGLLQAIPLENEKSVRSAIAQVVGVLVNHEFPKNDAWTAEVLKFIFDNSQSSDPSVCILATETFATLAECAPDQFVPHLDKIGAFCSQAMVVFDQSNNMANPGKLFSHPTGDSC